MQILFAISRDRRLYVEFSAEDLILSLPNKDLRGLLVRKFKSNTHEVCTTALFEDNNAAIKRFCRYSLLPYANKPEIHVHNYPELLLTNIANFTVKCGQMNKTVDGCRSCIYVLESGCSLISETIFVAGERETISGRTIESVIYPWNRAIIRAIMDEASLNGIQVDKVFKSAPKIELPAFKFYTNELDKKVVKDKNLALDLEKTAALAKTDEIAFDSLAAAALATKNVEIIRAYW